MPTEAGYVHLHGHSEYSLLDGACRIPAMAAQAAAAGMPALALTDHGNLFGAVEHYRACKEAGIKPIIGCEVYVAVGSRFERREARGLKHGSNHLVLLAKNAAGYRNLLKLVSKGYLEGYYYNPRIDRDLLARHRDGLVCLSGCVSGEIPHLLETGDPGLAEEAARAYRELFAEDFYLEIQRHGIDGEARINAGLVTLQRKLGIPLVATNDFHFLREEDHAAHDALICIQTGKRLEDQDRLCYPKGLYLKSAAEMQALFADLPDAVARTLEVADKCDLQMAAGARHMPAFPIPAGFATEDEYLAHQAATGLRERYGEPDAALRDRLEFELGVIRKMGYSGYFLIVQDYVLYAKRNGITVGPGRGSAAGSLVAYCLRITDTDPMRHGLLFERFLNPERISMPDIDIDFADTGRDQVIRYVIDKYGKDSVAQVITFGTMGAKAVIRDVGRVLGMPFGEVDRIAKLVPNDLKITLDEALERVPELAEMAASPGVNGRLIEYSRKLEGLARHASVHAAAVIIAPTDITDYVPLYRAPKDGRITTQFDGPTCESVGLLKMDFLGLKELSLMDEAVRLIRRRDPGFDLDAIPWDDRATFELFGRGDTVGVFQFESGGMREYLRQLQPDKLEDIIAMNALYRPGPMARIPTFIDRKHGREEVRTEHPILEPILAETYGVITYQEQVQRIARDVAGFTLGQADGIRKAMGKKDADLMERYKADFLGGAVARGVPRESAARIWADIEVFSGYGFNKSHSASYAEVAYKNAFLKANYPKEYMAASLTNDRNNTERLAVLLDECRRMGLAILPPDVNESALNFTPTDAGIRFGIAAIKNVGEAAAERIIAAREAGGPFGDLFAFCARVDLRVVNRRVLESLIAAGAMDSLEGHRAQQLAVLDQAMKMGQRAQEERQRGQISLFAGAEAGSPGPSSRQPNHTLPEVTPWTDAQKLAKEHELLGFYVSGHPLDPHAADLRSLATPVAQIAPGDEGGLLRLGGLVTRLSRHSDRKGQTYAFITLEDLTGSVDVAFFSEAYAACRDLLQEGAAVLLEGRASQRHGRLSVQAERAWPLAEARQHLTRALCLLLDGQQACGEVLKRLREACEQHPGKCAVVLRVRCRAGQAEATVRSRTVRVNPCDELLGKLESIVGPGHLRLATVPMAAHAPAAEQRRFRVSA